ncbi:MAG: hypothetical protein NXI12_03810 [Alphaproteobacteria bacterium]|nr:hypothetical protein [Alphaproteobacteria bacterium]
MRPIDYSPSKEERYEDRVLLAGGGYDRLRALVDFGRNTLDQASKEAFDAALNDALDGKDISRFEAFVHDLSQAYEAQGRSFQGPESAPMSAPMEPASSPSIGVQLEGVFGNASAHEMKPVPEAPAFETQSDMIAAIQDPRYRSDPTYAETVEARIAATDWDA